MPDYDHFPQSQPLDWREATGIVAKNAINRSANIDAATGQAMEEESTSAAYRAEFERTHEEAWSGAQRALTAYGMSLHSEASNGERQEYPISTGLIAVGEPYDLKGVSVVPAIRVSIPNGQLLYRNPHYKTAEDQRRGDLRTAPYPFELLKSMSQLRKAQKNPEPTLFRSGLKYNRFFEEFKAGAITVEAFMVATDGNYLEEGVGGVTSVSGIREIEYPKSERDLENEMRLDSRRQDIRGERSRARSRDDHERVDGYVQKLAEDERKLWETKDPNLVCALGEFNAFGETNTLVLTPNEVDALSDVASLEARGKQLRVVADMLAAAHRPVRDILAFQRTEQVAHSSNTILKGIAQLEAGEANQTTDAGKSHAAPSTQGTHEYAAGDDGWFIEEESDTW